MDAKQAIEITTPRHMGRDVFIPYLAAKELSALIERQEKQIAMYQMTIRLQDEHIAMKDKLLDVYRTRGGQKP